MPTTECECDQGKAVGKAHELRPRDEEKHALLMDALPMLIVFAMWLVAQVWLVGPLLFRR